MVSSSPGRRRTTWVIWLSTLLREHAESLILALTLAMIIRTFVVSSFVVRSDQMEPNLSQGDLVIAYYPPFGIELPGLGHVLSPQAPKFGDLVIYDCLGHAGSCLGRVMGLPGDRIEMVKQRFSWNGQTCQYEKSEQPGDIFERCSGVSQKIRVTETWKSETLKAKLLGPGDYWIMNDNRENEYDSRQYGPISISRMRARAVIVWLSINWGASSESFGIRWERTFHWLH